MHILKSQHLHITKVFPFYDEEKSEILYEGGSDCRDYYKGTFGVHIYRKGNFEFTTDKDKTEYKQIR